MSSGLHEPDCDDVERGMISRMDDHHHEHDAREAQHGNLHEQASANRDATWSDTDAPRARIPGVLNGEAGPKGRISAQLRDLSRTERSRYGEVPRGMIVDGTGRYVALAIGVVIVVLIALIVLIGWLAT